MKKQLKHIVVAGMIATLSFATLAGCGSKSTAKNDETTISDTVKQTQTQKQTEKTTNTADTKTATDVESTDVNNTVDITSEPKVNVAESDESDYEVSYKPDTPAYVPDTTDTAPADTPADIPDNTPADEPDTPAPAEPAVHEHNWIPVYGYVEWIENETGEDTHRRYIDENGNEVVITKHDFGNDGWLIDHYECTCGETKTGEDHEKIENYKNTKQISKGGLFYYKTTDEFSTLYKNTQRMKENLIS